MPRPSKGPRLYLRAGRTDARTGRPIPALYYIRDGARELGTGCGPDRLSGAEQALAAYIAEKWTPPSRAVRDGGDHPSDVLISEVLALYAHERAPQLADPTATGARIRALLGWWSELSVADVKRSSCQAYVAHRTAQPLANAKTETARKKLVTAQGARRELEDLSAAIGHWHGEHTLSAVPKVWLPEKPESPRDALTRSQAAALLWASLGWRKNEDGSWRRVSARVKAGRAHLRRFILIGLYTGTRPGLIPRIHWEETPTAPWVDVGGDTIYRRGRDERVSRTKRRPLVKLPRRLKAHLARWRRLDAQRAAARAEVAKRLGEPAPTTPNTVLHHAGRPIDGRIRRSFRSLVADAGLSEEITPHWLRHTCATWLMEAGVPIWEAAAFAGMTTSTLEKHYGHHRVDHQQRARAAFR